MKRFDQSIWDKRQHRSIPVTAHTIAGCAQGDDCTGPGCRLSTGKTSEDRRPRDRRHRVAKWHRQFEPETTTEALNGSE